MVSLSFRVYERFLWQVSLYMVVGSLGIFPFKISFFVILNVGEISKFYRSVPNDNCFILNGKEASPLSKYLKRDFSLVGIGMAGT